MFFGGAPRRVVEAVAYQRVEACATDEIVDEYQMVVDEMIDRKQGTLRKDVLAPFLSKLRIVVPFSAVEVCRDPDDDKFLSCAIDSRALYIVSGDKDLLSLEAFQGVEIITASEFCARYLDDAK